MLVWLVVKLVGYELIVRLVVWLVVRLVVWLVVWLAVYSSQGHHRAPRLRGLSRMLHFRHRRFF